jgi:hypothetical protein
MRRTTASDFNPDTKRCSAYHEAGHAVIGITLGLEIAYVTAKETDADDPHCKWSKEFIAKTLAAKEPYCELEAFTERFAKACLASRYSEAMICKTHSNEQEDAKHYDYLGIQVMRWRAGLFYFDPEQVERLSNQAERLVTDHALEIAAVAEQLLVRDGN